MVRNGEVDKRSSPVGVWGNVLDTSRDLLNEAMNWVGRIDVPHTQQGFEGTGFLIHKNLVVTNRHVLQEIADKQLDGIWKVRENISIDFGHEFRARESVNRRVIKKVIFAGPKPISSPIDHTRLDLAVLELEPDNGNMGDDQYFTFNLAPELVMPGTPIFTIGYPGLPGPFAAPSTLLDQLFMHTYGHKRLAPGLVTTSRITLPKWSIAHDATTLGGNSGSPVIIVGREKCVCAWGHNLAIVIDEKNAQGVSLRDCLEPYIKLKDPFEILN
jgi:V8-like Glu-specific endopeptidase